MSRIRHLLADCLLASSLIAIGPGAASASAAAPEPVPLQRPLALSAAGYTAVAARPSPVPACVAGSGVRSRINALAPDSPPVVAALTVATTLTRDRRAVTVVDDVVAGRHESLRSLPAMSRHVWAVPVCRSPPGA